MPDLKWDPATRDDDPTCEDCGFVSSAHDREHLATECFPRKIALLRLQAQSSEVQRQATLDLLVRYRDAHRSMALIGQEVGRAKTYKQITAEVDEFIRVRTEVPNDKSIG